MQKYLSSTTSSYVFTSESVSPGHPDKICDQISDALLDHVLRNDSTARCAFETFVTTNNIIVGGEVRTSPDNVRHEDLTIVIRNLIRSIGYTDPNFNPDTKITFLFHSQSPDIAIGVDANDSIHKEEGAGDQGIMFGYACDETPDLISAPLYYAHLILKNIWRFTKTSDTNVKYLGPDAKSQVSVHYVDGVMDALDSITLSIQHKEFLSLKDVEGIIKPIIYDTLPEKLHPKDLSRIFINPTGRFVVGGPVSDTGLTGRKIIVDTYGGAAPHGGGAFSGKDATKVDRSAAYMARYIAKNLVAAGVAKKATIQLSYVIGISRPISIYIDFGGTEIKGLNAQKVYDYIFENFPLTPRGIINHLGLDRPIYLNTATFGHFGRQFDAKTGCFSWENTDKAVDIANKLV